MANSIVRLTVDDSSFNAKIKEAARAFTDFGKRVSSAGIEAMGDFAKGAKTAKAAFESFNAALKANALVLISSLAIQAASAIGEMIGNWITGANDAADAQDKLNEKLEETSRLIDQINDDGDFNARIAKASGASTSQVLQMKVDNAREANNAAMSALFDPNIKVGTEEYKKAKALYERTNKRLQRAIQDQKVDKVAQENKTGEYAAKKTGGGGGRKTTKLTPTQQAASDIKKAEKAYADTMNNAQQKLMEQMIDSDKYDKEILQGQQKLADAYLKAYNMTGDDDYLKSFRETAEHINIMQATIDAAAEAHKQEEKVTKEQEAAAKKLADAQAEAAQALKENDLKKFYAANKKIRTAGGEESKISKDEDFTFTGGNLEALVANLKERISQADVGSELLDKLNEQLVDANTLGNIIKTAIENGVDITQFDPQALFRKIFGDGNTAGDYISDSFWMELEENLNKHLAELNIKPIKLDIKTGEIKQLSDDAKNAAKSWRDVSSAVQSVGSALQQIEDPGAKIAGLIGQAVANIALGFAQATATTGSTSGIFGWIAAIAGGLATMTSTIAAIHSATGFQNGGIVQGAPKKYATGGIIQGNTYSSDMIPIRANAGELILNRAQQGNIASQLEGTASQNLRLYTDVSGRNLRIIMDNDSMSRGKGKFVTSNNR